MSVQHVNAKIAEIGKLFPKNVVTINSTADFDIQDSTTITLESDTNYTIGENISTSKRFILQSDVSVSSKINTLLEYTGTGDMFTGVDFGIFEISSIKLRCVSANQIFNLSASSPLTTSFIIANVSSLGITKVGTFEDIGGILLNTVVFFTGLADDGITLIGDIGSVVISDSGIATSNASLVGLDFTTSLISLAVNIRNFSVFGVSGTIAISGLTNSDNIVSGLVASITGCQFPSPITPLSGISESDIRFEFLSCPPVADSTKSADAFLSSSQTVTIGTAGVFVAISGVNWSSDISERFTISSSGIATYNSEVPTLSQISITSTLEKVGGGTDLIELAVAINGTFSNKTISGTKNKDPTSVTSIGIFDLVENDTIQAFVANIDSTSNLIVSRSVVNVVNGF